MHEVIFAQRTGLDSTRNVESQKQPLMFFLASIGFLSSNVDAILVVGKCIHVTNLFHQISGNS